MDYRYIELDTAIAINRHLLVLGREGEHPVRVGCVEAALALPAQAFFGRELYPDLASKAAAYLFHLTQKHCFGQGNKRTAWAATRMFLRRHGQRFGGSEFSDARAIRICLEIARGRCDLEQTTTWIRRRLRPLGPAPLRPVPAVPPGRPKP